MRKAMKKLAGVVLAVALFVTMVPTQTAKADAYGSGEDGTFTQPVITDEGVVNDLLLSEEQLLEAYAGEWSYDNFTISKEQLVKGDKTVNWKFENTVVVEGVILTNSEFMARMESGVEPTSKVQALHFTDDTYDYYVYRQYEFEERGTVVCLEVEDKASGEIVNCYWGYSKNVGDDSYIRIEDELARVAQKSTEPTDEPKTEPTEEPKEEPKQEGTGRTLAEGETVYIVKKGDCLWSIAKKLLGAGKLYTRLFVRNGDIIKQADLIYPGQEVIIPVK